MKRVLSVQLFEDLAWDTRGNWQGQTLLGQKSELMVQSLEACANEMQVLRAALSKATEQFHGPT